MSTFAHVGSVAALKEFRVALCKFIETAGGALAEADAETHHITLWLKQDRYPYWKNQQRVRAEKVSQARLALEQKKVLNLSSLDEHRSFIDEKKALAAAQKALAEAEQKLKNIQRWIPQFEQEIFNYRGLAQRLGSALGVDLPNARAALDRMTDALEAYLALVPVGPEATVGAGEPTASMARMTPPPMVVPAGYAALRNLNPAATVRAMLSPVHLVVPWLRSQRLDPPVDKIISQLGIAAANMAASQKVLVAKRQGEHTRIYLERTLPAGEDDSGWTIGLADGTTAVDYEAVTLADLEECRPDLHPLWALPVGYLVVLNGVMIEAILDADDKIIWPLSKASTPAEEKS